MIISKIKSILRKIFIFPIRIYQKIISPMFPARCRYYPSCSAYAVQAIEKHGVIKGIILGAWRILRCNPYSKGGIDRVPEKFDLLYYKKQKINKEN